MQGQRSVEWDLFFSLYFGSFSYLRAPACAQFLYFRETLCYYTCFDLLSLILFNETWGAYWVTILLKTKVTTFVYPRNFLLFTRLYLIKPLVPSNLRLSSDGWTLPGTRRCLFSCSHFPCIFLFLFLISAELNINCISLAFLSFYQLDDRYQLVMLYDFINTITSVRLHLAWSTTSQIHRWVIRCIIKSYGP